MKEIKKYFRKNPGTVVYIICLVFSFFKYDGFASLFFGTMIIWDVTDYFKEKENKEYTDLVEEDRDKWYQKYVEEKYGKKDDDVIKRKIICKN